MSKLLRKDEFELKLRGYGTNVSYPSSFPCTNVQGCSAQKKKFKDGLQIDFTTNV